MENMEISIFIENNSREIDITLDVSSIDLNSPEEEMDNILRELVKEQYPEYRDKSFEIFC